MYPYSKQSQENKETSSSYNIPLGYRKPVSNETTPFIRHLRKMPYELVKLKLCYNILIILLSIQIKVSFMLHFTDSIEILVLISITIDIKL